MVESIQVTRRDTIFELPRFKNPRFFLIVRTMNGPLSLEPKPGLPIGNGLTWTLNHRNRIPRNQIYEIDLMDQRFLGDRLVDRVAINGSDTVGQQYRFKVLTERSWKYPVGIGAITVGALLALTIFLLNQRRLESINGDQFTRRSP